MLSMTGFAATDISISGRRWRWEAKSVNGRGLDLRFRMAEGAESLEPNLRALAAKRFSRGNISFTLRSDIAESSAVPTLNMAAFEAAIEAVPAGEERAAEAGLDLQPANIGQLLGLRGVMDVSGSDSLSEEALAAIFNSFGALLDELTASRAAEGSRIEVMFTGFIDRIEALAGEAAAAFAAAQEDAPGKLQEKVSALLNAGADIPPERLAQELALIAVKADVREELDRLASHVTAARALLGKQGPIGRKLDFLTQEFNREANTLCSKASSARLSEAGLELKVVIDQMREQAQNIE